MNVKYGIILFHFFVLTQLITACADVRDNKDDGSGAGIATVAPPSSPVGPAVVTPRIFRIGDGGDIPVFENKIATTALLPFTVKRGETLRITFDSLKRETFVQSEGRPSGSLDMRRRKSGMHCRGTHFREPMLKPLLPVREVRLIWMPSLDV